MGNAYDWGMVFQRLKTHNRSARYRSYIFITWILNFHLWIWYVSWSVLLVWCQLGTIGSSSYISLGQCVASDGEKKRAFWTVGVSRRIWKCDFPGESGTVCGVSFHQSHPSCWKRKLSKSLWASCIVAAAECKARPNFAQNLWQGHGSQNPIWETFNIVCFSITSPLRGGGVGGGCLNEIFLGQGGIDRFPQLRYFICSWDPPNPNQWMLTYSFDPVILNIYGRSTNPMGGIGTFHWYGDLLL